MLDIRRRQFITLFGRAAVMLPLAARAQQTAMPVVGLSPDTLTDRLRAFRQGLKEAGFIDQECLHRRFAEAPQSRENRALPAALLSQARAGC
jgi:hypothetical protein